MRSMLGLATAVLIATMGAYAASAAVTPSSTLSVQAALNDPTRPEKDTKQDVSRKPADMIAFSGIKSGDVVVDVWPGGGYWSRLFSKVVGPTGKVYAYVPAEITGFKSDPMGIAKVMAAEPGRGNIEVVSDPLASPPPPEFMNAANVVWTFENYHDFHDSFMKGADVDAFNRAVFQILKPGGVYVIIDHAAEAGSGLKHTEDLHRIDPAALRAEVQKAGFVFDGESKVLADPSDPHTALVFDPKVRGKTDRFAYRFMKPR